MIKGNQTKHPCFYAGDQDQKVKKKSKQKLHVEQILTHDSKL